MQKQQLGSYLKQQTKIPYIQTEQSSPALQEHIVYTQQIIKAFEVYLLEEAHDGNESAIDGLMYANVVSVSMSMDKIGGMVQGGKSLKETKLQNEKDGDELTSSKKSGSESQTSGSNKGPSSDNNETPKTLSDFQQKINNIKNNVGVSNPTPGYEDVPDYLKGGWFDGSTGTGTTTENLKGSQDLEEGTENWFADCIPCGFRLQQLSGLDPFGDLLDSLLAWINEILEYLAKLWAMLNQRTFIDELCALLDFLNFMCIPDLMSMLAILQMFVYDIIKGLYSLFTKGGLYLIWGLLSPLFIYLFSDLEGIIDTWIQMIMAPINCVIGSILTQVNKFGGLKAEGLKEMFWRTASPEAYSFDPETGGVKQNVLPQEDAEWQQTFYKATYDKDMAETELNAATKVGDQVAIATAKAKLSASETTLEKLQQAKVPSVVEEEALRRQAIGRAFAKNPDIREKGVEGLDAEGWLLYVQQITTKTLYYAASYLLEARDSINAVIAELKHRLTDFLGLELSSMRLKMLGLEKLKNVIRLIDIIASLVDVIKEGRLVCEEETDVPSEESVANTLTSIVHEGLGGLKSSSEFTGIKGKLIKVTDENGQLTGYTISSPDFDPLTGGYVPLDAQGKSQLPDQVQVTDQTNLKGFIPLSGCLKSSTIEKQKMKKWLEELQSKSKLYGV